MKSQKYDHIKIENKWQSFWKRKKIYKTPEDNKKPKCYVLDMFPYPSGAGLHVGHPRGYIATDIYSRYKRMNGLNVLHPMGFDAFGLPAENFAIKNKMSPDIAVKKNVERFKEQLGIIGLDYDWEREINTTDPKYYKWTQWIFLKMFEKGLAYESYVPINWCPSCKTGLANEDIEGGKCEQCGTVVEKKPLRQWVLKIREYADRLLEDLDDLEWPEHIKESQRNWIGRSEGAEITFKVKDLDKKIKVFTTRPDTLFGLSYVVIAPENELVDELKPQIKNWQEVEKYRKEVKNRSEMERTAQGKEKTGVKLSGIFAINPVNKEEVPVFIADYVLANYGTGAVMAVPAHDERDYEFAKKYDLPIREVISGGNVSKEAYIRSGGMVNSGKFDGMTNEEAMRPITEFAGGKMMKTYKIQDWVFSRQRYWGEPIPLVHCEKHGVVPVLEKDLPVKLPKVKSYEPTGTGESPLASISSWVNTKCPLCLEEKDKTKHLMFDFDGVLADTKEAWIEAAVKSKEAKNREEAWNVIKGYLCECTEFKNTWFDTEKIWPCINKNKIKIFSDFVKEIKKIKNAKLAVVSSGSETYIKPLLEKTGIKFSHIMVFEDGHSKEEKVKKVCNDWNINTDEAYYFTDANRDVSELEKVMPKKNIIGCAWGYLGKEILLEALPERQILDKPEDIRRIFNDNCEAKRETNTMPQWAGSSWYYLRYIDPQNDKALVDKEKEKYWMPVDMYVGGTEHATRHLIYARFWHKFLYDLGVVSTKEPFRQLRNQGMILGADNRKMSKRWGNVVNPDDVVKNVGADTLRIYESFMGPFDQEIAWNTDSMVGSRRFLEKVWKLKDKVDENFSDKEETTILLNKTIKKVGKDIETFSNNTAVSSMMILANDLENQEKISKKAYESYIKILSPFAPHMCEEIWENLGNKNTIVFESWPEFDESKLAYSKVKIAVQINGKVRGAIEVPADSSQDEVEKIASSEANIIKWLDNKKVVKKIFVKDRILNLVIQG